MQSHSEQDKPSHYNDAKKILEAMLKSRVASTSDKNPPNGNVQVKTAVQRPIAKPNSEVGTLKQTLKVNLEPVLQKITPIDKVELFPPKQAAKDNEQVDKLKHIADNTVVLDVRIPTHSADSETVTQNQTKQDHASLFANTKNKIEGFSQLLDAIDEFNTTQQKFHEEMEVVFVKYKDILNSAKVANHYLLIALLDPYTKLKTNPFPFKPGKTLKKTCLDPSYYRVSIEKEIDNITSVISPDNKSFSETLASLFDCSSNQNDTLTALTRILNDKSLPLESKEELRRLLNRDRVFDKPNAHLMRYRMLLENIVKYLHKADYNNTEHPEIFEKLKSSMEYLKLVLLKIDKYRNFMSDLNRTDRLLAMCLDKELNDKSGLTLLDNFVSYNSVNSNNGYQKKIQNIVLRVSHVINSIKTSLVNVDTSKEQLLEGVLNNDIHLRALNEYMSTLLGDLIITYDGLIKDRTILVNELPTGYLKSFSNYIASQTYTLLSSAKTLLWAVDKQEQSDPIADLVEMKLNFDVRFVEFKSPSSQKAP